jgi:hypothetical protein
MGTTLTNQNCIHKEIKSTMNFGHAYYHLVQNILSSSLLSKNIQIKTNRTIILLVVLCGCEIRSVTLREEYTLRVFENEVFFFPQCHHMSLMDFVASPPGCGRSVTDFWLGRP